MKNAFTVDLEDWFCSHNLLHAVSYQEWDKQESRVERNTELLLTLLQKHQVTATFFVLGWVADRFPGLIRTIHQQGHEIGSHGYAHQQLTNLSPEAFEADLARSMAALQHITGMAPQGYRAPAFSITPQTQWALPLLKKYGFAYDSSVYPFSGHPDYGNAETPLHIHQRNGLVEVPLSCAAFGRVRFPCSGGAYLRFYPFPLFRALASRVTKQQRPLIFYIHPWELDGDPPKVPLPFSKSVRHYYNTRSSYAKIDRLLGRFEFTSIKDLLTTTGVWNQCHL